MSEELRGLTVTFEDTKKELDHLESKLAAQLGLSRGGIRAQLLALDRKGKLTETELVADWYDAYAAYLSWFHDA